MSMASGVGLMSGLNFDDILSKMRQVNARPQQLMRNNQQKIQTKMKAMQAVNKSLVAFNEKLAAVSTHDAFYSKTISSTDFSIVGASVTNSARTGSHSVEVLQLAQAHRIAAQGVETSANTSIATGNGTFEFQLGDGSSHVIEVSSSTTLQDLADAINNLDNGKVRASIINDGTATHAHRLVLNSEETGADNTINIINNDTSLNFTSTTIEDAVAADGNSFDGTVASSGTYTGSQTRNVLIEITTGGAMGAAQYKVSLDGGLSWTSDDAFTTSTSPVDVTGELAEGIEVSFGAGTQDFAAGDRFSIDAFHPQLREARDGMVEVDGVRLTREGNTYADVVEGVTLTAKKLSEEVETITINNNSEDVAKKISAFVEAYNGLVDQVDKVTAYDVENQQAAPLFGDASVNAMMNNLNNMITRSFPGLETYTTLNQIGVTLADGGKLQVEESELQDALDADIDAVAKLFIESGSSTSSHIELSTSTESTEAGQYTVEITQAAERAAITGQNTLDSGGLAESELLSITLNDRALQVTLDAGSTLSEVVSQLNETFLDEDFDLEAREDDGKLQIRSAQYGSDYTISVRSNRDAGLADQLGIGTSKLEDTGVDVAGEINGVAAQGTGQLLQAGDGNPAEGLELTVTATAPLTAIFNLNRGAAIQAAQRIEALTDETSGLFATREDSYSDRIKEYSRQIEAFQDRLDAQMERQRQKFVRLESKLAELQNQSNFLNQQLSQLMMTTM